MEWHRGRRHVQGQRRGWAYQGVCNFAAMLGKRLRTGACRRELYQIRRRWEQEGLQRFESHAQGGGFEGQGQRHSGVGYDQGRGGRDPVIRTRRHFLTNLAAGGLAIRTRGAPVTVRSARNGEWAS